MAVDRVGEGADADVEMAEAKQALDRRPPPDNPGVEGAPSRADSRAGAMAANESDPSADEFDFAEAPDSEQPERRDEHVAPRPYAERLDTPISDGQPTPREVLARFDPVHAGLPEISENEARNYIKQNADQRPWLASAKDCDPAVQRVIAAMDQGQGHALERHEGYADDEKLVRRVTALEDPAQLDSKKREAGIDGCKPGNQEHRCGTSATAIHDPAAFATLFARGVDHPDVQEALQASFDPGRQPPPVSVPIEDLLGVGGSRYCSGYELEPIGGSLAAARECRAAWVEARTTPGRDPDVPDPVCKLVTSFEGAMAKYAFQRNFSNGRYEVATMYVDPPRDSQGG